MEAFRRQALQAEQQGLFKAATVRDILVALVWSESSTLPCVRDVDTFVTHSWASPAWMKLLAICQHQNFDLAIRLSVGTWLLLVLLMLLEAGGFRDLVEEDPVYLHATTVLPPIAVFLLVYFAGQVLRRKTVWFLGQALRAP